MRVAFKETDIITRVEELISAKFVDTDNSTKFDLHIVCDGFKINLDGLDHSNESDEQIYKDLIEKGYIDLTSRKININWGGIW